jgi:uncharacterized phage protein gp47/JayE
MAELYTFVVRDPDSIRDSWLRTLRAGLIARGVASPNVTPGSDFYAEGQAIGNELAVAEANGVISADDAMPDTATGVKLDRAVAAFGMSARRGAAGGVGTIVFDASAASLVATGVELVDGAGLRYGVTVGGTYSDGDNIPIEAIDTGGDTNLEEEASLRWVSPPTYAAPTALVGDGGLINGTDAEDDETLRARLYEHLRNPPRSGNAQHVAEIAEDTSPSVQKAFVYPALQGPGTTHVAVVAAPTETNKNRSIATAKMTGTVVPGVEGQLNEHSYVVTTTVTDTPCDVAFGLTLPAATTASPPGPGGGWLDAAPWPVPDVTSGYICAIVSATSSTRFVVNAATAPTASVSRIAWLSPLDWKLYKATVTTVHSSVAYAIEISIDTPFIDIAAGHLVWPQCARQDDYVAAVLAAFHLMGPGEKTTNVSSLIRGYRHPPPSLAWPYALGANLTHAIEAAGDEVASAQFLYRDDGTTTLTGAAGTVSPTANLFADIEDPPLQYVPNNIAFYKQA